ncbi:hypothetical protein V8E51_015894 [Hyaloscypha variabilis]
MYNQGSVSAYNEGGYATDYTQTPFQYGMGVNDSFLPSSSDYWQADVCNISQPLLANAILGDLSRSSNEECILAYGPGNGNMRGRAGPIYSLSQNLQRPSPSQTVQFSFSFVTRNICPTTRATTGTDLAGKCLLQCSLVIMICVLGANAVKLTCMTFVLLTYIEPVLATVGDGIATFLERPDPFTVDRPFLTYQQARRFKRLGLGVKVRYHQPRIALRWWNAPADHGGSSR